LGELQEEAKAIRQKIKHMVETNRLNDKTFVRQQEYLVALNNQYRILCDKLGVAPSMNFTRQDELNQIILKKKNFGNKRVATESERGLANKTGPKNARSKSVKETRDPVQRFEVFFWKRVCSHNIFKANSRKCE